MTRVALETTRAIVMYLLETKGKNAYCHDICKRIVNILQEPIDRFKCWLEKESNEKTVTHTNTAFYYDHVNDNDGYNKEIMFLELFYFEGLSAKKAETIIKEKYEKANYHNMKKQLFRLIKRYEETQS